MARPMILVHEELLTTLHTKYKDGVKYDTLIRNYQLPFTGPTLKKLLKYFSIMQTTNTEVSATIHASLFPEWLELEVQHQNPAQWIYRGDMPLGTWEKRLI